MQTPYYQPSNKCSPMFAIYVLCCIGFAYPFAWLYAWLCDAVSDVFLDFLATMGFSFSLAILIAIAAEKGHSRNPLLTAFGGWLIATAAWYEQWACWWNFTVHQAPPAGGGGAANIDSVGIAMHPDWMLDQLQILYHRGAWNFDGFSISGIFAVGGWLLEYLLIISCPIFVGYFVAGKPYCEGKHQRAKTKEMPAHLQFVGDIAAFVKHAEAQPEALEHLLKPAAPSATNYSRLKVEVCGVGEDSFATVDNLSFKFENGKKEKSVDNVLTYLRIPFSVGQSMIEKWGETDKADRKKKANKTDKAEKPEKEASESNMS